MCACQSYEHDERKIRRRALRQVVLLVFSYWLKLLDDNDDAFTVRQPEDAPKENLIHKLHSNRGAQSQRGGRLG